MPKTLVNPESLLQTPIDFDALLATLAAKDRARVEKQLATYETAGSHELAGLWKRLMCRLSTLAPHRTKFNAPSIQFYEQDGKNRRQVFAMDDSGDGNVTVYCEDIFDRAVDAGVLRRKPGADGKSYPLAKLPGELLIERIDGKVENPPEFFKHMVGWNRKALRITLPLAASNAQVTAAELLCAISLAPAGG